MTAILATGARVVIDEEDLRTIVNAVGNLRYYGAYTEGARLEEVALRLRLVLGANRVRLSPAPVVEVTP